MKEKLPISVKGHLTIKDDEGNIYVDKENAVHPQNLARVFARALANEHNYFIHRIAFGNGGTVVDAAYTIRFKEPNDGIRDGQGWQSRLYNEVYSEIIDESNVAIGTGLGADPTGDPASVEHSLGGPGVVSQELGLTSQVVITCVLNANEPATQPASSVNPGGTIVDTEGDFVFDEIGLFTTGAPPVDTAGFQDVDVGTKFSTDDTGLLPNTSYTFDIIVDGGAVQTITITTPSAGSGPNSEILYSDLVNALNTGVWGSALSGATAKISEPDVTPGPSTQTQTFGKLRFESNTTGAGSSIELVIPAGAPPYPSDYLFSNLTGFVGIDPAVPGKNQGVSNQPTVPENERERLLTHIIFSPISKARDKALTIVYVLTISVAQTP